MEKKTEDETKPDKKGVAEMVVVRSFHEPNVQCPVQWVTQKKKSSEVTVTFASLPFPTAHVIPQSCLCVIAVGIRRIPRRARASNILAKLASSDMVDQWRRGQWSWWTNEPAVRSWRSQWSQRGGRCEESYNYVCVAPRNMLLMDCHKTQDLSKPLFSLNSARRRCQ